MVGSLIFCVEGGGTKSRACLVDAAGKRLTEADSGPCNPSTGFDRAVANFTALWQHCSAAAGHDPGRSRDVILSIGAAGMRASLTRDKFLAAIPRFAQVTAVSDGYASLIGAGGGAPCSLMIIGTGVAGHRLWPNGQSVQRDAWGWIGGDRGSGTWLGIRALRHTLAAIDGIHPGDGLSERLLAGIGGRAHIVGTLSGISPDRLASFAPIVLAAAEAGVPSAVEIRARAIEHLAALARALDIGEEDALYAAGGLAATFAPSIAERIGHPVTLPDKDAMHGCLLIATGRAPMERVIGEAAA
jgi:glucosamine kinase